MTSPYINQVMPYNGKCLQCPQYQNILEQLFYAHHSVIIKILPELASLTAPHTRHVSIEFFEPDQDELGMTSATLSYKFTDMTFTGIIQLEMLTSQQSVPPSFHYYWPVHAHSQMVTGDN